jgi:predicted PurR-regulated permease PerM
MAGATHLLRYSGMDAEKLDALLQGLSALGARGFGGFMPHLMNFSRETVLTALSVLLGLVLSVYLLWEKDQLLRHFSQMLKAYLPPRAEERTRHVLRVSNGIFGHYLRGQLLEALILGVLCYIGMLIFRFPYPFVTSVIIGASNLIPIVGSIFGALPPIFIQIMEDPARGVWFLVFVVVLHQLEGNLIYPKVVGESIGLPALWVLLAILLGGGVAGVLGMVLGVPATAVVYRLIKESTDRRLLRLCDRLKTKKKSARKTPAIPLSSFLSPGYTFSDTVVVLTTCRCP